MMPLLLLCLIWSSGNIWHVHELVNTNSWSRKWAFKCLTQHCQDNPLMRCEEACHWFKPSWIIWASSLDQVKKKEAHGNNLVQELVINVKFNIVVHHDFTSDTRFNKWYITISLQVIYMVIQVIFTQVNPVQQWWFHKWSSTLSDQIQIKKATLIKKSSRFK